MFSAILNNGTTWVAGGSTLKYSTTGKSWTTASGPTNVNSLAWTGTQWLAGCDGSNNLYTSIDAITWYLNTSLQAYNIIKVAYANNTIFVLSVGTIFYSQNFGTWSSRVESVGAITGFSYTGTHYLFSSGTTLIKSQDLTTWTTSSLPSASTYLTINNSSQGSATVKPITLACSDSSYNTLGYTYDGIQWYGTGNAVLQTRANHAAWNGTIWVTVGKSVGTWFAISRDGINWQQQSNSLFDEAYAVAWNDSYWLVAGEGATYSLAKSTDGVNWTGIANSKTLFSTRATDIAWNGSKWTAYGSPTAVATSTDGINWSLLTTIVGDASSVLLSSPTITVTSSTGANPEYAFDLSASTSWTSGTGLYNSISGLYTGSQLAINIVNSGSGAYIIDGVNNGDISLIRGNTYNLVINATGHPFWIQSVSGGYSSNDVYNSGITNNGTENSTITFTVPSDAPNTLYYACQYHSSMQGRILITNPNTINIVNSGSGAYIIDGVNNGDISLIRGNTYNLVINATGHPFWIQSVSGGYSSNNVYNSGITNNGTENSTITFTVPSDAPNTLYYACQYHSSMQGRILITDPSGEFIQIDLTSSYAAKHYSINSQNGLQWLFVGSSDGSNWTTLDTQTMNYTTTSTNSLFLSTANTTAYRYYRFVFQKVVSSYTSVQVKDIDLFLVDAIRELSKYYRISNTKNWMSSVVNTGYSSLMQYDGIPSAYFNTRFLNTSTPISLQTSFSYNGQYNLITDLSNANAYYATDFSNNVFTPVSLSTMDKKYSSCYNGTHFFVGGSGTNLIMYAHPSDMTTWFSTANADTLFSGGKILALVSNSGLGFVSPPNTIYLTPGEKLSLVAPKFYDENMERRGATFNFTLKGV
jgi:hypothetical protein